MKVSVLLHFFGWDGSLYANYCQLSARSGCFQEIVVVRKFFIQLDERDECVTFDMVNDDGSEGS